MQTVRKFILRLLVDPADPDALRGAVEPVPEGESQRFVGEQELLLVLRRLISLGGERSPAGKEKDKEVTN